MGCAQRLRVCCLFSAVLVLAGLSVAGDLNPPPGAIAPTMVSLAGLAHGRLVNDLPGGQGAVHVISEPGSYILTSDIVAGSGQTAIVVALNPALPAGEYGVSIDLNGRSITGLTGAVHAIDVQPGPGQTLRFKGGNGAEQGVDCGGPCGIFGFDGDAITGSGFAEFVVEGLWVSGGAGSGVHAAAATTGTRKKARTKGKIIMNGGSTAAAAIVLDGFDDVVLEGEMFIADYQGPALDVHANPLSTDVQRMKNQGKNCMFLSAYGLVVSGYDLVELENFTVVGSSGAGVTISGATDVALTAMRVSGSRGHAFDIQCDSLHLRECVASGNAGDGMRADARLCSLDQCSVRDNGGDGVASSWGGDPLSKNIGLYVSDVSNNVGNGVSITHGSVTIDRCTLEGNGFTGSGIVGDGLSCAYISSADVRDTIIRYNAGAGLRERINELEGRLKSFGLLACRVTGNGGDGAVIEGDPGAIAGRVCARDCEFSENAGDGLALLATIGAEVRACTLNGNGGAGVRVAGTGHTIVQNSAADNGLGGFVALVPGNSLGPVLSEADVVGSACQNPFANLER